MQNSKKSLLTPIQLPNISDVVYSALRQQILLGELAPGEQLNLTEIEQQLEVSRTPLKSALARLQADGLVEVHPRRGTYVTQLSRRDIEDCFEIRIALEAQALRSAFVPRNAPVIEKMMALITRMESYFQHEDAWVEENADYMACDREMHLLLVALSGNQRMVQMYEQANVQGYIAIMGARFHYSDVQKTQREHAAMKAALLQQDLPRLLETARTHLENARDRAVLRIATSEPNP